MAGSGIPIVVPSDACVRESGYPTTVEWALIDGAATPAAAVARIDAQLAKSAIGPCAWRDVIRLRGQLGALTPALRQTALQKLIRLADRAGAGDAARIPRSVKREVLRATAAFAATLPNAAWALAVDALRSQYDPSGLQWAMLTVHLILSDPSARSRISTTERNAALVEMGRIATTTADASAPISVRDPDAWSDPDPIPLSWTSGSRPWAHRYAASSVATAAMFFGTWRHLLDKPCDPTLPPDDLRSIYQCYPDLAPPGTPSDSPTRARDVRALSIARAARRPALVASALGLAGIVGYLAARR